MQSQQIAVGIEDIAVELPSNCVTNDELAQLHPDWDMSAIEKRAGVIRRYFADSDETAVDLAERACLKLFGRNSEAEKCDTLLFCTQTPDYILPASACVLHKRLGLPESVFAFDLAMGCSGFVNGLALCEGLLASGRSESILLVTADTLSKRVGPDDRSTRVLFGDGAAVTWMKRRDGSEIIDIECSTSGRFFDKIIIPDGGCRNPYTQESSRQTLDSRGNSRSAVEVYMDGLAVLGLVSTSVPSQVRSLLSKNDLSLDEIDHFFFHQASGVALDTLCALLGTDRGKVFRNIDRVGNTVSASIPIAISEAWEAGLLKRGQLLFCSGFGVGLSWASAVLRF